MSLDTLLKGSSECEDVEETASDADKETLDRPAPSGKASGSAASTATDTVPTGDGATVGADPDSWSNAGDGKDHVNISWRDGIHVHASNGAEVHVGWGGIHVDDPGEDAHVHIGADGMNIHADGDDSCRKSDIATGYGSRIMYRSCIA